MDCLDIRENIQNLWIPLLPTQRPGHVYIHASKYTQQYHSKYLCRYLLTTRVGSSITFMAIKVVATLQVDT